MTTEGPLLESLTRRLTECPAEFLAEPRIGSAGKIHVEAVVSDLIHDLGGEPLIKAQAAAFQPKDAKQHRNRLSLVLITAWLLRDPWFIKDKQYAEKAYELLAVGLGELAQLVKASVFVTDPDRREELARMCLKALDLRPGGETDAQALDRYNTLNSAERQRVIRAAREAEERARQIREEMAKKEAEEAADKWSRE